MLRLFRFCFLLLFFTGISLNAQNWEWGKTYGGTNTDVGQAVTTDATGNVYSVSQVRSATVTINSQTFTGYGDYDVFVVKYRADGQFVWARIFGSTQADNVNEVLCDPAGNVYLCGNFEDTIVFGNDTLTTATGDDAFLVKLDSLGNCLWARGTAKAAGASVSSTDLAWSSQDSSVVMVGSMTGAVTFDDTTMSSGSNDVYFCKWSAGGQRIFTKCHGFTATQPGAVITIDTAGTIYLGFMSTTEVRILKENGVGVVSWSQVSYSPTGAPVVKGIAVDLAGNVTLSGHYNQTLSFSSYQLPANSVLTYYNAFLVQYDSTGTFRWAHALVTPQNTNFYGSHIDCDGAGNIYFAGYSSNDIHVDSVLLVHPASTYDNLYVLKFASNGNLTWSKLTAGTGFERTSYAHFSNGSLYVTGTLSGTGNYDSFTLTGSNDALLLKLAICSPTPVEVLGSQGTGTEVVCAGGSVVLNASFVAASGYTYQWTSSGAAINGATANTLAVSASGLYGLVLTDSMGCAYTAADFYFTVLPPVSTAILTTPYGSPCNRDSVLIHVTNNSQNIYTWLLNGNVLNGPAYNNSNFIATLSGNYQAVVTSPFPCTDSSVIVPITIGPDPVLAITADTSICTGASVQLGVSGANSYVWSPAATLSSSTSASPIATPAMNTTYTVTATNGSCVGTDSVTVSLLPSPSLTLTADTSTCLGVPVQLNAAGASQYAWLPVAGLSSDTIAAPVANAAATITYTVTGTLGNCTDVDSVTVAIYPVPSPAVQLTYQPGTLSANYASGIQWYFNNAQLPGATSQNIAYTQNGDYYFTYTDPYGCVWTSAAYNVIDVSVNTLSIDADAIFAQPNPFSGATQLITGKTIVRRLEVFNVAGEQVEVVQQKSAAGITLDMTRLPAGIYFVRVETEAGGKVLKLVKN